MELSGVELNWVELSWSDVAHNLTHNNRETSSSSPSLFFMHNTDLISRFFRGSSYIPNFIRCVCCPSKGTFYEYAIYLIFIQDVVRAYVTYLNSCKCTAFLYVFVRSVVVYQTLDTDVGVVQHQLEYMIDHISSVRYVLCCTVL